jgi:hypothetical protein
MSLYNFVTDNFKEYDLDTEYCLDIYKYVVCESRDISDRSGAYIILLELITILFIIFDKVIQRIYSFLCNVITF